MACILVVDDEEDMLEVIAFNLERAGHGVLRAQSGKQALEHLAGTTPDLIISDIMMPGMDGIELCMRVRDNAALQLTPFLFVTAKTQTEDKYKGLRAGADDYVTKPFELPDLLARVHGRLEHRARVVALSGQLNGVQARWQTADEPAELRDIRAERRRLVEAVHEAGHPDFRPPDPEQASLREKVKRFEARFPKLAELRRTSLVGDSPAYLATFEELLIAASSPDPTLIFGETGTGKTAAAQSIHQLGPRARGPFRTVNCSELAAGDPTIASGKLFGYGKNSGLPNLPKDGQPGILEECDGGVLFLDEVATLPAHAQALLLLPLEGRGFHPAVGTGTERKVDVKFVMATNRDLEAEVEAGRFPRDLFQRMNERIQLPALRERPDDVPRLVAHFVAQLDAEEKSARRLAPAAAAVLQSRAWNGNVRELRNAVRHAYHRAALHGRDVIERADIAGELPDAAVPAGPPVPIAPPVAAAPPPPPRASDGFTDKERSELDALRATRWSIASAETRLGYSNRSKTLTHRFRGMQLKALALSAWDIERAARLLAGDDATLAPEVGRRLRATLDHMQQKLDEPDQRVLAHLLIEHRQYAVEALARLRSNRR